MSNNEKKVIESPFVFRTGMIIQCDNSDKNITIPSYLKMAYKGIIGPVQLHILDILYEYGYITRHTLSILMPNETTMIVKLRSENSAIMDYCESII